MRAKIQRPIKLINTCNAIYDDELLKLAIIWFSSVPVNKSKKVFLYGKYPAIAIRHIKLHIHRLLYAYINKGIKQGYYVHHKDGNLLNANIDNLEMIEKGKHQSMHNKDKKISDKHIKAIIKSNKKRKGKKYKIYENPEAVDKKS